MRGAAILITVNLQIHLDFCDCFHIPQAHTYPAPHTGRGVRGPSSRASQSTKNWLYLWHTSRCIQVGRFVFSDCWCHCYFKAIIIVPIGFPISSCHALQQCSFNTAKRQICLILSSFFCTVC